MKQSILILFFFSFSLIHSQINSYTLPKSNEVEGILIRIDSFPTKYIKPRKVDVWLPTTYSEEKKYSVLYMHDGQMLFDATTTWNKQEWKVDEVASKLMSEEKVDEFIVVAIWNIPELRHMDLYPKKPYESLSKEVKEKIQTEVKKAQFPFDETKINSDNYLKFIVEEVKPYIDENYSVFTDANHTAIMGSSMGGLISMYALCEYPEIFGKAACLSTHWVGFRDFENNPIPESFFTYLKNNLPNPETHKIYFDYGTETLDASYLKYEYRVDEVLQSKEYTSENYKNLKFEGENHSEVSWQKRIDIPFEFMFGK
ncbi:alpha/beta hydrolase [Flavobacterium ponti]|uniref:Alpha/beta hydrolase n=1 Tax=Flavobacterium ponti TaxID=665133 RepID=A0ABV9NZI9_9FLAO